MQKSILYVAAKYGHLEVLKLHQKTANHISLGNVIAISLNFMWQQNMTNKK